MTFIPFVIAFLAMLWALLATLTSPRITADPRSPFSKSVYLFVCLPVVTFAAHCAFQWHDNHYRQQLLGAVSNAEGEATAAKTEAQGLSSQLDYSRNQLATLRKELADSEGKRQQAEKRAEHQVGNLLTQQSATMELVTSLRDQLLRTERDRDRAREEQRELLKQLQSASKNVARLDELLGKDVGDVEKPIYELIKSLGGKTLRIENKHITSVSLAASRVTDEDLKEIARLSKLDELDLRKTQITSAGLRELAHGNPFSLKTLYLNSCRNVTSLEHVGKLTRLTKLELDYLRLEDEDLVPLAQLANLEELSLYVVSEVTDAGIRHLSSLTKLTELWLTGTKISDVAVSRLAPLRDLRILALSSTAITDEGVRHLTKLAAIEQLWLGHTNVTDVGLDHLAGLPELSSLHLSHTKVTDDAVPALARVKKLRHLHLDGTGLSAGAIDRLKQASPTIKHVD